MQALPTPDYDLLKIWLEQLQVDYYLCGSCNGLHLTQLQAVSGVYDAKLEIEGEFLFCSASIELRPTGVMPAHAELSRLNALFPTLKIFVEIVDDTLPRMILCHNLATRPGISEEQFEFFVHDCIEQIRQAAAELKQLGVIYYPEEDNVPETANVMH